MTNKLKRVTNKPDEAEVKASEVISLDEYIAIAKPHYGLVVSFKHEASKTENGLADRSEAEWEQGFEDQSNKEY